MSQRTDYDEHFPIIIKKWFKDFWSYKQCSGSWDTNVPGPIRTTLSSMLGELDGLANDPASMVVMALARLFMKDVNHFMGIGLQNIESPIEKYMFLGLVMYASMYSAVSVQCERKNLPFQSTTTFKIDMSSDLAKVGDNLGFVIRPQAEIADYRVDFEVMMYDLKAPMPSPGKQAWVIVECDGHEFHDKTKEQARRDRKRDRDLQARGYYVLRFTGSEIWENPFKCAETTFTFLKGKIK